MTGDAQRLDVALGLLRDGAALSSEQVAAAFSVIMSGVASDEQLSEFLTILAKRGPTGEEIHGASTIMRECVDGLGVTTSLDDLLDTCGTGGAPKTFNVSTVAALVAAAAGARVAKHGNRSRTGRGSAEVLCGLGVAIDAPVEIQQKCLEELGICFCFAPRHHPAVRHVMPVRKALGFPTIFNLLGPLTNPCGARCQVIGVWDAAFLAPMAEALSRGPARRAIVLHSEDGLDEGSISAPTTVLRVEGDQITEASVAPEDLGLQRSPREHVEARDLDHAIELVHQIIGGAPGAPRDMIILNTALALEVVGCARTLVEGARQAEEAIDSGAARELLDRWCQLSQG